MSGTLDKDPNTPAIQSSQDVSSANAPEAKQPKKKSWFFDTAVYAGVVNVSVFLLSVFVTYNTNYGVKEGFWRKRGDISKAWTQDKFEKILKLSPETAKESANNAMMVLWSFVDGSLLAPVAAWLETKRPQETDKEAKAQRSLKSLLLGRAATAAIIVPTAIVLDKTGWNGKLLNKPGERFGNWVNNLSITQKLMPNAATKTVIDNEGKSIKFIEALGKIGVFEIFYTSVCTLGLWASSAWIANAVDKHQRHKAEHTPTNMLDAAPPTHEFIESEAQAKHSTWAEKTKTANAAKVAPRDFVSRVEEPSSRATPAM